MNSKTFCFLAIMTVLLSACSGNAYQNVVPKDCVALAAVDMKALAADGGADEKRLADMIHVGNMENCGLDFSEPLFLFESRNGDFGCCVRVNDVDELETWIGNDLTKSGKCKMRDKRKGFGFAEWNDSWLMGYSDTALLLMGPVLPAAMAQLQQQMVKYLSQDEDKGMKESRLTEVMDTMRAPVKMVARMSALPPTATIPFAFGVPKTAGENDVYLKAEMTKEGLAVVVEGETFSFKENVNKEIKQAQQQFLPVGDKWMEAVSDSMVIAAFFNVEGDSFLQLIHTNKAMETVLTGANLAIDMDKIIRSMKGEVVMSYSPAKSTRKQFALAAQLKDTEFLKDLDYWKSSCPKGTSIVDKGQNNYLFTGGEYEMFFGVVDGNLFIAGSSESEARALLNKATTPLLRETTNMMIGKRLALCVNAKALADTSDEKTDIFTSIINAIFGDTQQIVYYLK
ncbi:MAG: DUF4836 family protein [Prevotella sp.]|nr:DUF4836 family protein [Prevotella sp.]